MQVPTRQQLWQSILMNATQALVSEFGVLELMTVNAWQSIALRLKLHGDADSHCYNIPASFL